MRRSEFTDAQIAAILDQVSNGSPVEEVCRSHGISPATYYQWESKLAAKASAEPDQYEKLQKENIRLKKMYAELALKHAELQDFLKKSYQHR